MSQLYAIITETLAIQWMSTEFLFSLWFQSILSWTWETFTVKIPPVKELAFLYKNFLISASIQPMACGMLSVPDLRTIELFSHSSIIIMST